MPDELLAIADELYALTLPEFTPARDAKAKELKGTDLAKEVKALKKPSLAAWVVNLLVRGDTAQVEQVLQVGAALREAQASMSGDDLRQLTRQRRQLTAAVTTQARRLAREAGQKVTEAVADQVEATLTAAMVDEDAGRAVRSGLLVSALSPNGVDSVALDQAVALPDALGFEATAPEKPKPELHVVPDPDRDEKALAAAREALDDAEEELSGATAAHDEADAAYKELEARSMQVQAEIDELKRKVAELEESADEVDEELSEAEDARIEAEEALAEATKARDAARKALDKLDE